MIPQNSERRGDWSPFLNRLIPFPVPFLLVPICLLFFFVLGHVVTLQTEVSLFRHVIMM